MVGGLNLSAAGWYWLPDADIAYPYGLGVDATANALPWVRRHEQALSAYLRLNVEVFVGTKDLDRDDSLRKSPDLDRAQGRTRVEHAQTYVRTFRAAAMMRGVSPNIELTCLPGVTHDVAQAIKTAGLDRLVTTSASSILSKAR